MKPLAKIKHDLESDDWSVRRNAMWACQGRRGIPFSIIEQGLKDKDCFVHIAALYACRGRSDMPLSFVEQGLKDKHGNVRQAAIRACVGRSDIPLPIIEQGLKDKDCGVHIAALKLCTEECVTWEVVEGWLTGDDNALQQAGIDVCEEREIPPEVRQRWDESISFPLRLMANRAQAKEGRKP